MKKSQSLTIWIVIGTILALIGFIFLLFYLGRIRESSKNVGNPCLSEMMTYPYVESLKEIKLKECQINYIDLNEDYLKTIGLDKNDVEFMTKFEIKDEKRIKILKILTREFLQCYRNAGSGNYNILSKIVARKTPVSTEIEKANTICLICASINISKDIFENIKDKELKDFKFISYLTYYRTASGTAMDELENTPLGRTKFYLEDNFNVKFKSDGIYNILTVFSYNSVIPRIVFLSEIPKVCDHVMNTK